MPEEIDQLVERARQRIGTVVSGKWTIDRLIGVGGMAVVYAATHRNKKRAALKMLHAGLSVDSAVRERFLREGYVANSVEHDGVVRVDDDDVAEDGSAYLVMELLEGETLDRRWARKGHRLPVGEVLSITNYVLDVLVVAHAAGVVHRDLKPENVFVHKRGVVKILDFGIARVREMGQRSTVTRTGSIMGTPAFMAPEQARGRWNEVDVRTDLWAVGAMMFTLLTGRFVHQAETANETLALAMTQPAPRLASVLPDVPREVARVVDQALAYRMDERFQDATAMQQAVRFAYHATQGAVVEPLAAFSSADLAVSEVASASAFGPDGVPAGAAAQGEAADVPQPKGKEQLEVGYCALGVSPAVQVTMRAVTRSAPRGPAAQPAQLPPRLAALGAAVAAAVVAVVVAVIVAVGGGEDVQMGPGPAVAPDVPPLPAPAVSSKTAGTPTESQPASSSHGALSLDELPVQKGSDDPPRADKPAAAKPVRSRAARQPSASAFARPKAAPPTARGRPAPAEPAAAPAEPSPGEPQPTSDPFARRR
jgi:tRNA A-37 threonylcarbamoyl transferase component Bud32